jgi:hypothetical protein
LSPSDAYDNSVAYTDWFLQQLIQHARALKVPATLTFFPDHGEDVGLLDGTVGHGSPTYTRHAFEIPAFVWMNEAFRQAHPEKVAAMKTNASKEIGRSNGHHLGGRKSSTLVRIGQIRARYRYAALRRRRVGSTSMTVRVKFTTLPRFTASEADRASANKCFYFKVQNHSDSFRVFPRLAHRSMK